MSAIEAYSPCSGVVYVPSLRTLYVDPDILLQELNGSPTPSERTCAVLTAADCFRDAFPDLPIECVVGGKGVAQCQ